MTITLTCPFSTLPVELIHHIFDYIDSETILNSVRYVCKRLYIISDTYNRYHLNFQSIAKHKYHQICRAVNWENVQSILLSDHDQTPGQLELFLSIYSFRNLTRLQTLALRYVKDTHLKIILEQIQNTHTLHNLSITFDEFNSYTNTNTEYLSSIIGQSTLHKLDLSVKFSLSSRLQWPNQCFIQHLRLFSNIFFSLYCKILERSPYLKTIILQECIIHQGDILSYEKKSDNVSYRQLLSLTLENSNLDMDMIEFLLGVTPCLVHLRLKSTKSDLVDGLRWENFMKLKLPALRQFEFSFQKDIDTNDDVVDDVQSLMSSFQTPFWRKVNQGYITLVKFHQLKCISLHSIPLCGSVLRYYSNSSKSVYSTAPLTLSNAIKMKNVRELHLDLIELLADNPSGKNETLNDPLCPKVSKLYLQGNGELPFVSLDFLSDFVSFSSILELVLDLETTKENMSNIAVNIQLFLNKLSNLQSLIIKNNCIDIKTVCSIVPRHILHLQVKIQNFDDAKIVLENLSHLSSVAFFAPTKISSIAKEIIDYLTVSQWDFVHKSNMYWLKLWLGKKKINV